MPVYVIGTLDTKGREIGFVRDELRSLDVEVRILDAGCLGDPTLAPPTFRAKGFEAAGTTLADVQARRDRGHAVAMAAKGVARLIADFYHAGQVDGLVGVGGSAGTTIATAAMRELPVGVPKVMASTLASGQVRPYVGNKDILMLNTIVDISGLNRVSRLVLGEAARAMAGMVRFKSPHTVDAEKPIVAATMFGVTTPCVEHARQLLEKAGYEVLVFHATGTGGQSMESLIDDGLVVGVLDITTTELADELVGGVLTAGPERLTAAGRNGIPQVISVGGLDMVNFGPPETIPADFENRKFYHHNANVTLMRTTVAENEALGEWIGRKAAASQGATTVILPLKGVSAIDADGQPFDDPEARSALFRAIRKNHGKARLIELDYHINDPEFAAAAVKELISLMAARALTPKPCQSSPGERLR